MWRDVAIAMSLANLCYLRVWSELLTYSRSDTYLMKLPPGQADYAAAMLNALLLGGMLWLTITFARGKLKGPAFRFAEMGFLLFLAVPLQALRSVLANSYAPYLRSPLFAVAGTRGAALVGLVLVAGAVLIVMFWHRPAARLAAIGLLWFFPFTFLTFGQAIWKSETYNAAAFAPKPLAPPLPNVKNSPRVLWVIFDEWDYRLTFVDRDASLWLPEIDHLRNAALFATNGYPPGPETTISFTGYFTGRLVRQALFDGPDELLINFRDSSRTVRWSEQPNVFERARELGFNTALVDWFTPSCRVLNKNLTYCEWWEKAAPHNSMGTRFRDIVINQTRSLFETERFSLFGQSLSLHKQVETYHAILDRGLALANNRDIGFSVVHFPIPHSPHAYDRRTGDFTLKNSPIRGYVDSLALLDRTLSELRRSMQSAGTWDSTTILITSDHPYREAVAFDGKTDPRIPFLLKLAGQNEGVTFERPFNAVVTQDLLLSILRGELSGPKDVVAWLNQHTSSQQAQAAAK
jgi:hypothetical protein